MKKIFALLLTVITACLLLTACTDPPDQNSPINNGENNSTNTATQPTESETPKQPGIEKMYITVNGKKLEVTLAQNCSTAALIERLKQGDISYEANDYGGFEKVGSIGFNLPTDNTQITAQSGDVVLYAGNQIVIFYGSNSWSYTRLGKINGYSAAELKPLLEAGNGLITVTLSLTN